VVDCIIDMRGEEHGVGIKNETMNESHFGRFRENPVMPGMLMIGGMGRPRASWRCG
jgi:3-hydroxyacyl-[acyl-carrier-protein] dehydratase